MPFVSYQTCAHLLTVENFFCTPHHEVTFAKIRKANNSHIRPSRQTAQNQNQTSLSRRLCWSKRCDELGTLKEKLNVKVTALSPEGFVADLPVL